MYKNFFTNIDLTQISNAYSKIEKRWFFSFQERKEIVELIREEDQVLAKTIKVFREEMDQKQFEDPEKTLEDAKEKILRYFKIRSLIIKKSNSSGLVFKIQKIFLFLFKSVDFNFYCSRLDKIKKIKKIFKQKNFELNYVSSFFNHQLDLETLLFEKKIFYQMNHFEHEFITNSKGEPLFKSRDNKSSYHVKKDPLKMNQEDFVELKKCCQNIIKTKRFMQM